MDLGPTQPKNSISYKTGVQCNPAPPLTQPLDALGLMKRKKEHWISIGLKAILLLKNDIDAGQNGIPSPIAPNHLLGVFPSSTLGRRHLWMVH